MIWRLHIFFSLLAFNLLAAALHAATVSGTVVLRDSHSSAVNRQRDFSGVVVFLEPVNARAPLQRSPLPPEHAQMRQKNKTFTPHVLPVVTGTVVDFPNFDPFFHHAFSSYNGQVFDVGLYPPGTSRSVRFAKPGVVRVFCNIHATMSAIILVLDTPYFTTSGKEGGWSLDVPPGEYTLHVFHERATAATLQALSRRLTVTATPVDVGPLTVSEAGYLQGAHKNKFGKDYPATPDDRSYYPGVRK